MNLQQLTMTQKAATSALKLFKNNNIAFKQERCTFYCENTPKTRTLIQEIKANFGPQSIKVTPLFGPIPQT